ncbi:MFS transporter [Okibacterium endophyticum]
MTTTPIPLVPGAEPARPGTPFPWIGLITLSVGIFLAISSEMMPTGLLPEMSRELGVTEAQIGLLVSIFAFTVVISAAPLSALTVRIPRHALLVTVIAVLGVANLLTAVGPSYELVLASRVLGGLAHGLFWSLVPAYAAHLVPREQLARAVSIILAGGTIALVLGVPIGTALGHAIGWRWSFVAVSALLLVGAAVVLRWLPKVSRSRDHKDASGTAGRDRTIAPVVVICVVVGLLMIGNYSFYTYIAPYLIDRVGVAPEYLSIVLFVAGSAGAIGLVLSGTVFAKRSSLGLVLGLIASALAVIVLAIIGENLWLGIAAVFVWNASFGLVPPLLQTRMLHTASERFRDTASAYYTVAFNVGIGAGAAMGALLLDWQGLEALPFSNIVLTLVGLAIVSTTLVISRARR